MKKACDILLIVLSVIGVLATTLFVYVKTLGRGIIPHSITSTYALTQTDPITGEKMPTLQANYYENLNCKGYRVMEFRVNGYSGIEKRALYPRGFQMVWNADGDLIQWVDGNSGAVSDYLTYDLDPYSGFNFATGHTFKMTKCDSNGNITELGDPFIVDIDEKPYALILDGTYKVPYFNFGKSFAEAAKNFFSGDIFNFKYQDQYDYVSYMYGISDLMIRMAEMIKSCSHGTGDYILNLADLGDYLHMYEISDKGTIKIDGRVGGNGFINSYFSINTHYDTRGMVWAKQSIFGSVLGDSNYNLIGINENVEYWKAGSVYNLSEQDFEAHYSSTENGYYYALPVSLLERLKTFTDVEFKIYFNLSKLDVNVLGFDYFALEGLKINQLTISNSNGRREFKVKTGALKDTGLSRSMIVTYNISLTGEVAK